MFDETPLSIAIRDAPLEVIKLLFDHGGSIERGELLHFAICRQTQDCLDIVKLVLAKGAPVNSLEFENDAISWSWWKSFGLGTPLHTAAKQGKADVAEELLKNGADPSILDSCGRTALKTALAEGQNAVVELLGSISANVAHKL
jgi:Ankyrin repeats (many copies)/Ankyrin repeat